MKGKNRLVLIDGHSVLFRAYHAYPPLTTSKGELINAVYGFTNILLNVIRELEPTHLAVTFDRDKPTFRHTEYVGYKAQREEMPTDLAGQQERVEEVVKALNIPIFAVEGFEADDVIGTLAKQAVQKTQTTQKSRVSDISEAQKARTSDSPNLRRSDVSDSPSVPSVLKVDEVVIVTGDNDVLQLVEDEGQVKVRVYMPGRGKQPAKIYGEKAVEEKYGLEPEQIPDMKGLSGDASDNIPGVRGIGPKTAARLLREFKTVEAIYRHLGEVKNKFGDRVAGLLIEGQEEATLSKKLATIERGVPIELDLDRCRVSDYHKDKAVKLFRDLEFKSLIAKLPDDDFEKTVQEVFL